ncbi:Uncharacterized protein BM_BM1134 [Brugia malayi]|uniref:Bm1134 n=1 Tax=Brugia malayi TaxID=6279 RepID=A0A4E9EUN6_BRUMA|nr:Uncharacterized protein BM_BM1134 [Brugia malayi]
MCSRSTLGGERGTMK